MDVDGFPDAASIVMAAAPVHRVGTLQRDLPFLKDVIDYRLTAFPRLYLFVERFRQWINWDKRVYLSFVRRGDTVLDVGANVGAHALFLSHLVRGEGKVLAFEPLIPNALAFEETLRKRSRIDNITLFRVAVGNPTSVNQSVVISAPGDDLTQASLRSQAEGSWKTGSGRREFRVPLSGLDSQAEVQALASIDFVKIDVEGGELDVLEGAKQLLSRHRPCVYCEVYEKWAAAFGYTPADVFALMRTVGYEGARVISRGSVRPLMLDGPIPGGIFDTSSDVLFFGEKHREAVAAFDKRYLR
jgi:FkbM family methyltransferase